MASSTLTALVAALGADAVVPGDDVETKYLHDWNVRLSHGSPLALVRPRTTAEVSAVMRVCHAADVPVVPQGGRTGIVGGATPVDRCVILSLERLTGIEEVDDAAATLTVAAGTPLQHVQEAARAAGLFMAIDLGARGSAQIGGLVATNAGGNRVIRYGMMRDLVLGVEAVLADGTVVTALNKLIKNNTGPDVRQLFVGSEGTLGVITRIVLRLHPQPRSQNVAFCALTGYDAVLGLLKQVRSTLGASLSAFEAMWPDFYALVTQPGGDVTVPLPHGAGLYVLVEALGTQPSADRAQFEELLGEATDAGLVSDCVVAQSTAEAASLWRVRDASGEFPRVLWPHVPFDIGIPTRDLGRFVDLCGRAIGDRWPEARTAFYGHVGDANLHLCAKLSDGEQPEREVDDLVYGLVREWGGTVSAEHGIGVSKRPYLSYCRTPAEIAVMRALKHALDPTGILNPGKVF